MVSFLHPHDYSFYRGSYNSLKWCGPPPHSQCYSPSPHCKREISGSSWIKSYWLVHCYSQDKIQLLSRISRLSMIWFLLSLASPFALCSNTSHSDLLLFSCICCPPIPMQMSHTFRPKMKEGGGDSISAASRLEGIKHPRIMWEITKRRGKKAGARDLCLTRE